MRLSILAEVITSRVDTVLHLVALHWLPGLWRVERKAGMTCQARNSTLTILMFRACSNVSVLLLLQCLD